MIRVTPLLSAAAILLMTAPIAAQQGPNTTNAPHQSTSQTSSEKAGSGVQTATEHAVRVEFYSVRQNDIRASDLIGMEVRNVENENIGEVSDIVLDDGKNITAIILDVGGFLGLGEESVAVTPASLLVVKQSDGSEYALVNATKEILTTAPRFKAAARRG